MSIIWCNHPSNLHGLLSLLVALDMTTSKSPSTKNWKNLKVKPITTLVEGLEFLPQWLNPSM